VNTPIIHSKLSGLGGQAFLLKMVWLYRNMWCACMKKWKNFYTLLCMNAPY